MPMTVVGYIRCSTDRQADQGYTLEAQEAKLRQYAQLYELDLLQIIVDAGASAKTLKRPGLQQALKLLTSGQAQGLLIAKLDRLTRSVKDMGLLIERYFANRYALMSVADQIDTATAAGRLVLNVLVSVGQWEREAIGERTRDALQHKKCNGEKLGGDVPYGYRLAPDGVRLLEDVVEQAMLTQIQQWQIAGQGCRVIARALTVHGYVTRKGTPFRPTQVQRLLKECRNGRSTTSLAGTSA